MLELLRDSNIKDPSESQRDVYEYCHIIHPGHPEAQISTQKTVFSMCVSESPIVAKIPETVEATIEGSEDDKNITVLSRLISAIDAQGYVERSCENVLSAIK
jgi:hypothetical protein